MAVAEKDSWGNGNENCHGATGEAQGMTQLSAFFKALADPTRLRVVNLLLRSPMCVCEMAAVLQVSQPLLSRHLAYLRNSGLIEGSRQGLRIQYELNGKHPLIQQIQPFLVEAFRGEATGRKDLHNLEMNAATQKDKLQ